MLRGQVFATKRPSFSVFSSPLHCSSWEGRGCALTALPPEGSVSELPVSQDACQAAVTSLGRPACAESQVHGQTCTDGIEPVLSRGTAAWGHRTTKLVGPESKGRGNHAEGSEPQVKCVAFLASVWWFRSLFTPVLVLEASGIAERGGGGCWLGLPSQVGIPAADCCCPRLCLDLRSPWNPQAELSFLKPVVSSGAAL